MTNPGTRWEEGAGTGAGEGGGEREWDTETTSESVGSPDPSPLRTGPSKQSPSNALEYTFRGHFIDHKASVIGCISDDRTREPTPAVLDLLPTPQLHSSRARSTRGAPHAPTSPRKQPSAVPDSMPLPVTHPQLRIRVTLCWGQGPPAEMTVSVGNCSSLVLRARLAGLGASATSWSSAFNCRRAQLGKT